MPENEGYDNSNLLIRYRQDVAPELVATTETDALLTWDEWKWAFYHWKYHRDIGSPAGNDFFLVKDPALYFEEPPTFGIRPLEE